MPAAAERPPASATGAADLQREVVANLNYDASQVEVRTGVASITVLVTDSNLLAASHAERDADGARIAHVLEQRIATRPELSGVQAIHVEYVAREGAKVRVRDSMDYRRDKAGRFQRDLS